VLAAAARLTPASGVEALPAGANILVSVSFTDMRSQPDYDKDIQDALSQADPEFVKKYDDFKAKTGLDPVKDLDSLSLGVYLPAGGPAAGEPDVLALVAGRFDPAKLAAGIETLVSDEGAKVTKSDYKGQTVYAGQEQNPGATKAYWAVTDKVGVIGNSESRLQAALDLATSGKTAPLAPRLKALTDRVDSKATVWAVGYLPEKPKTEPQGTPNPMAQDPSDMIREFLVSFDGKAGMDLKAEVSCKDAQSAMMVKNQIEMMRGFLGMMALQSNPNMPAEVTTQINSAIQKILVSSENDRIAINVKMTKEELDGLKKALETMKSAMAQPGAGAPAGTPGAPGAAPAGF
jgi:hypothetical protein